MPPHVPKPQSDRIRECLAILKKILVDLDIPQTNPSIQLLKKRMVTYWHDGRIQEDRIPLVGSNRYILYKFPRWEHQIVEIVFRAGPIEHKKLSPQLQAELDAASPAPTTESMTSQSPPSNPEEEVKE